MQCPNCKVEMNEGSLNNHGMAWTQKVLRMPPAFLKWLSIGVLVSAYRCPNCKRIELKSK